MLYYIIVYDTILKYYNSFFRILAFLFLLRTTDIILYHITSCGRPSTISSDTILSILYHAILYNIDTIRIILYYIMLYHIIQGRGLAEKISGLISDFEQRNSIFQNDIAMRDFARSRSMPSPPTKSLGFRGLDSSRLLSLKGGNAHVRGIL